MTVIDAQSALKKYFGYEQFRPMQEDIIQAIYEKKDALVLMPTGGGKSICFQIPAVTMDGVAIVLSPLISLMKDQVESLLGNGIKAAFLNSSLTASEQRHVEDDLFNGNINLLYVSPEKLVSSSFIPLLKGAKINLFAIDEAHCISSWGHDFRPEYTKLKFLKQQFPDIPIIALTATADKVTRRDIVTQLGLENPEVYIASFDRPNLSLDVRPGQKRLEQIIDFIKPRENQAGIIYCLSRKNTEQVAEKLNGRGINAMFYHAGLPSNARSKVQEDFLNDNIQVVCATVAFGMGIDKSNVRWVIHYNLPKNVESYYQEIGRAGRDGVKADTLLFYSFRDVMVLRDILGQNESDQTEVKLAKLERMQQFAESLICRRKILLNYFGENHEKNCGNCDVCKNPPTYFDGTVIAQKGLSALIRLRENVGMNMLINVLRGSGRREIFELGYNKIKTYGAGREFNFTDWQFFLQQMLNLGLIEVAYDQKNVLKVTDGGKEVLFNSRPVQLVRMTTMKEAREKRVKEAKPKTQRQRVRDELFDVLRKLRKELAQQKGVPPYIIFSDASLEEMAATRPINESEMMNVNGVGERKMELYGQVFMATIRAFIQEKSKDGLSISGGSLMETLTQYKKGKSIPEIAEERGINERTIYIHIAKLVQMNEDIRIEDFVSKWELTCVKEALEVVEKPVKLKPIYQFLDEKVPYHTIQIALAHLWSRRK